MKKLLSLVSIIALAVAAWWYFKKEAHREVEMAALVPADSVLFAQVSDLERSETRWKVTELAQIMAEPAVQAFFEKPRKNLPKQGDAVMDGWSKVKPARGYLAVTKLNGEVPVATLGFQYRGAQKDVQALVAQAKDELKKDEPTGKADLVQYNGTTIETYALPQLTVATAFVGDWFFAADDLEELKATLDRFNGKGTTPVLEGAEVFKTSLAQMPKEADVLFYLVPKELVGRLKTLALATGQSVNPSAFDKVEKIQAITAATKLEGPVIHDAMFTYAPDLPPDGSLEKHAMVTTSADTLLFFASCLQWPDKITLPDPATDVIGYAKILAGLQQALATQGLTLEDALKSFGPEAAVTAEWADSASQPSALFTMDVKDKAKAEKALDLLSGGSLGSAPWAKQSLDSVEYYGMPSVGLSMLKPTLALSDRFLVAGLSYESVKAAVVAAKTPGGKLDQTPQFKSAQESVKPATHGFGYVDSQRLFQKVYGQLRPLAMMYASFSKEASEYMDASKLPEAGVISKHLTPIVYSSSKVTGGSLVESVGPVTMSQAALGVGAVVGAVAVPLVKNYLPALNGMSASSVSSPATPPTGVPAPGNSGSVLPEPSASATPESSAEPAGAGNQ
jgi:hypothetical protein